MKRKLKTLTYLFLLVFAFNTTVFAAEVTHDKNIINMPQKSENIRSITKQEYCEAIAKSRGISVEKAEEITNDVINKHKETLKDLPRRPQPRSIRWGSSYRDEYGGYHNFAWVYKRVDAGGGMFVEVGVPAIIYVFDSYAREFVQVNEDDCYAKAVGSGSYTFNVFSKQAKFINDTVHLNARGAVEVKTSTAANLGLTASKLISFGFSIGADSYARKTVTISHVESLY
ncbi:hypothetical protein [Clostridium oceanicum]|uniref:Uncharacterized protein n=1 Tax=Clostridium oceanicum TaxID=1543 RepID=A0ABP3USW8_9CLOT